MINIALVQMCASGTNVNLKGTLVQRVLIARLGRSKKSKVGAWQRYDMGLWLKCPTE